MTTPYARWYLLKRKRARLTKQAASSPLERYFALNGLRQSNRTGTMGAGFTEFGFYQQGYRSPAYQTKDWSFFIPSYYVMEDGTDGEVNSPSAWTLRRMCMNVGGTQATVNSTITGGTTYVSAETNLAVDPALGPGVKVTFPGSVVPANSTIIIGIAGAVPDSASIPVVYSVTTGFTDGMRRHASSSFATAIAGGLGLSTVASSSAGNFSGFIPGPCYATAQGGDGRPVYLITSDSIGYGRPNALYGYGTNRALGIIEPTLEYGTRIASGHMGVAGSKPSVLAYDNANAHAKRRALADKDGGKLFTHWLVYHGTNSAGAPYGALDDFRAMMKCFVDNLTDWKPRPVDMCPMAPKVTSTDGFRTTANQTPGTIDASTGLRWKWNDDLKLTKLDGMVRFVFDTAAVMQANITTNRDKFKVRGSVQLTRTSSASATQLYVNANMLKGEAVCLGNNAIRVVETSVDQTGGEWLITTNTGTSAGTFPAGTIGQDLSKTPTMDGTPTVTGLHPSPQVAADIAVSTQATDWKASMPQPS